MSLSATNAMMGAPQRVRVKYCGMTRPGDARRAAALGVDAIGLIFYPPSPRAVTVAQARAVLEVLPPFVTSVGVFVDPSAQELHEVLDALPLDLLQFHGGEDPGFCAAAGRPWIKSLGMREGIDVAGAARRYGGARALLLDTFSSRDKGGTGRTFDWSLVPGDLDTPLVLAGGLEPGNVGRAIDAVRPFAVDVNGGVESSPGIKDAAKMKAFMREVQRVQAA